MYTNLLTQAGLSEKEASVYEKLLEIGPSSVGKLIKSTPFKRGDLYNILYSLRDKGLLAEELKKGVMTFTLESPEKLQELVKTEKEKLTQKEKAIAAAFPQLKSLYNLSMNRPGVRFYEGEEGVWKVLEDTLSAKTDIYSYADIDSIVKHDSAMNKRYARLRAQRGIRKKGIVIDTPFAREYLKNYLPEVTETKFIALPAPSFGTVTYMYDATISFITFAQHLRIGVIIEDAAIAHMQKILFEYLWTTLPSSESQKRISNAQ